MRIVVAKVSEFAPGERRIVQVGGRSIGVFRVGERFYALNNHCPHQGGPLCLGRTAPTATSTGPGEFGVGDDLFLACPWHGWEYDITTGQSYLGPGEKPVRGYGVAVTGGENLTTEADLRFPDRIPGPYVAETFDVHVEEDYVVVDTTTRQPAK
ncbi:MAG TPA: Rieske (2Fe-2S) protein [Amycolatopsis sp.]|jgi:3-phenylpropionate/trans-cinnamate dioxygenase ferredoxin subunit|nr:Rieske (2Fe-2S) protein [Amycolatopsis sp.]